MMLLLSIAFFWWLSGFVALVYDHTQVDDMDVGEVGLAALVGMIGPLVWIMCFLQWYVEKNAIDSSSIVFRRRNR